MSTGELTRFVKNDGWTRSFCAQLTQRPRDLIETLGHFALLRSVSNNLAQAPELVDELCQQISGERAFRESPVLPFQLLPRSKC